MSGFLGTSFHGSKALWESCVLTLVLSGHTQTMCVPIMICLQDLFVTVITDYVVTIMCLFLAPVQFVAVMFWSIYAIDRELIYPLALDKTIPFELNHLWHTTIVVCVLIELVVVFHRFPSNWTAIIITFIYSFGYMIWIVWIFTMSRKWPYPFFNLIPPPVIPLFFLVCSLIGVLFYFLGKGLCYLRWPGKLCE